MSDVELTGSGPAQVIFDTPDLDAIRALREAEERYRSLVEHIPAITYIYEMDDGENTIFMSPQVEAILGYTPAEMLEDPDLWWDRVHVEDRERVIAETDKFNKEGDSYRGEYRMIARDGTEVWIQDEARLLRDEQGRPKKAQGVLIDISERKHLEEQLRQSQRMEAVGRLAGGVAHDFNNLLAVIQNYARFLFEDLGEADPRREDAGEILAAGERATTLVRQLLTFSRKEAVELRVLDLNVVVVDMEKLLRRSIGEDVRLETRLAEDLWLCKVDQGQMDRSSRTSR
ncbi:MAG: PAS domain-containing protein [Actinomycetota bacterium]|nr:PAS domain-containing protein [Actinomycetota bacterium]